jgi:histidine ammonia-lyase
MAAISKAATHTFDDAVLSVQTVCELSAAPVQAEFSPRALERMARGREIVERCLASGAPIYGATTGIGSQKDVAVHAREREAFGNRMIVSEATPARGPAFPQAVVRGALVVLCHNLAKGQSGIRPILGQALLTLLASPTLPEVRRDCAFGVADLTPLAQLALPLIGRSLATDSQANGGGITLAPKESVSLIDNNSVALAEAALMLRDAAELLRAFDLAAAVACEGFRAGLAPHTAGGGNDAPGQHLARAHLFALLECSALHAPGSARFLQDPLSFRSITQVHGAAYETLNWVTRQVEAEINAAVDNPLVDLDRETLLPSASMVSVLPVLAIDSLRQALAKVTVTSHERSLKLQSPAFSGLPVGLAADGAADGGILSLNLHYIGAARLGSLTAAAAPVLLTYIGHTADGVEDVSTLLPLAVTQTREVIARAFELAVLEMIVGVWAIARRGLAPSSLGRGPRLVYDALLPMLHIGEEGTRIFDFAAIIEHVEATRLVRHAFWNDTSP